MGCDCKIRLPAKARVGEVADVIAKLFGCRSEIKNFDRSEGIFCDISGVKTVPSSMVECCYIEISKPCGFKYQYLYHFEAEDFGRLIMPASSALGIALGRRLVQYFGGSVDYNDCDEEEANFRSRGYKYAYANDGKAWEKKERYKNDIKALTRAEVKNCEKYAAYGHCDWVDEIMNGIE
jgi:hypothetical protein